MTPFQLAISIIGTFLPIVPLSIFMIKRKRQARYMKYLAFILLFSLIIDALGMTNYFWIRSDTLNPMSQTVYQFLFLGFITLFYKSVFPVKWRKVILAMSGAILLLGIYLVYSTRFSMFYGSPFNATLAIVTIIFCLIYFYRLMQELPTTDLKELPMFWINTGFLIYFSGSLILLIFKSYLAETVGRNFMAYWIFHNIFGICKYILFSIAFWKAEKQDVNISIVVQR